MRGLLDPSVPPATVAGLDLVRGRDGELLVLEDNLRMPSGAAYAAARCAKMVEPALEAALRPRRAATYWRSSAPPRAPPPREGRERPGGAIALRRARRAAPGTSTRGSGASSGMPIVDARPARDSSAGGSSPVSARERRAARRHLPPPRRRPPERRPTAASTALGELLLPALRSGRLRCVNAFGTGLADDKLAHVYVERMVGFYLGEEPLLRSVPSYRPQRRAQARRRRWSGSTSW